MNKNRKKLNLGCGKDVKEGWINLDKVYHEGVDIIHDLNSLPIPFNNDSFDLVLCRDVLEHVNFLSLIDEIYRILKIGGILMIRVPHFTSKLNYEDPTHQNLFSVRFFDYYVKSSKYSYNRDINLYSDIFSKKIIFNKEILFKTLNVLLEKLVNKSENWQDFYENTFLRVFPAMNIEVILIK